MVIRLIDIPMSDDDEEERKGNKSTKVLHIVPRGDKQLTELISKPVSRKTTLFLPYFATPERQHAKEEEPNTLYEGR